MYVINTLSSTMLKIINCCECVRWEVHFTWIICPTSCSYFWKAISSSWELSTMLSHPGAFHGPAHHFALSSASSHILRWLIHYSQERQIEQETHWIPRSEVTVRYFPHRTVQNQASFSTRHFCYWLLQMKGDTLFKLKISVRKLSCACSGRPYSHCNWIQT